MYFSASAADAAFSKTLILSNIAVLNSSTNSLFRVISRCFDFPIIDVVHRALLTKSGFVARSALQQSRPVGSLNTP
jgi:hypothetical protein